MDTSVHTMENLFAQLGLSNEEADIDNFISSHSLEPQTSLIAADFWSRTQSEFLREAVEEDAEWVGVVDQLDARLHHKEEYDYIQKLAIRAFL